MNTYKITGANKDTGADYSEVFRGENEDAARQYASTKGVLVSEITLCEPPMPVLLPTSMMPTYDVTGTRNGEYYRNRFRAQNEIAARKQAQDNGVEVKHVNRLNSLQIQYDVANNEAEYLTIAELSTVAGYLQLTYIRKIAFWVRLWSILSLIALVILIVAAMDQHH